VSPTFPALGVPADLCGALRAAGITHPFPVQEATLPDALAGHDLCGRAPTGSGKTLAFGIPLVARVTRAEPHRPTGLVLVPTRELALQVTQALVPLAMAKRLYVLSIYGGAPAPRQISSLRRGASIVVATPGRLIDLVEQGQVRLDAVQVVVLDEADRMADMGFLPQVRRLLDATPASRQTMLWSATLDGDVDTLVRHYQRSPRRHELAPEPERLADVPHHFWTVDKMAKVGTAALVVRRHGTGIVFVRTKHGADRVARQLSASGVASAAIHGDRSQSQRERALQDFRSGKVQALVATDVAARGIHVDGVEVVVHWDPVDDHKDYVHRSGRTGRAGARGVVVSLVTPEAKAKTLAIQRSLDLPVGLTSADAPTDGDVAAAPRRTERAVAVAPAERGPRRDDRSPRRGPDRPRTAGPDPSGRRARTRRRARR
jgi:superfamily II DNA/RNA helicase